MARHTVVTCDVCRKPTERIVGKIHFVPMIPGVTQGNHGYYSDVADIGVCCKDKVFRAINFRPRMTKDEYADYRRDRARTTTIKPKPKVKK